MAGLECVPDGRGTAPFNHGGHPHAVLERSGFQRAAGGPGDVEQRELIKGGETWVFSMWLGSIPRRGWTCRRAKRGAGAARGWGFQSQEEAPWQGTLRGPLVEKKARAGLGFGGRNCRGLCFRFLPVHTDVQEEGAEAGFVVLLGIRVTLESDLSWGAGIGGRHGFSSEVSALPSRALLKQENWVVVVGMGSLRPNGL